MEPQKKYILDYRIILKPDKRTGGDEPCFVAYCPTLGIADDGGSPQEALENIHKTITFHLECLQKEGKEIPVDKPNEELVTNTQVELSLSSPFRFAN